MNFPLLRFSFSNTKCVDSSFSLFVSRSITSPIVSTLYFFAHFLCRFFFYFSFFLHLRYLKKNFFLIFLFSWFRLHRCVTITTGYFFPFPRGARYFVAFHIVCSSVFFNFASVVLFKCPRKRVNRTGFRRLHWRLQYWSDMKYRNQRFLHLLVAFMGNEKNKNALY